MKFGLSSALILLAAGVPRAGAQTQAGRDTVRIISVSPAAPWTRGVPTEVHVEIEAVLRSADSGIVRLGFNTTDPNAWTNKQARDVHAGRQRVIFVAHTVPVDWGDDGIFSLLVTMLAKPLAQGPRRPIALDRERIGTVP